MDGIKIPIKPMPTIEPLQDLINHPDHYHKNGIDVIGFSESQFDKAELKGFYRINILKYVTRYDRKGKIEDLEKAKFYLNKLIALENGHVSEINKRLSGNLQLQEENLKLIKDVNRLKVIEQAYEGMKKALW